MMQVRGNSPINDKVRDDIEQSHPQITIIDLPQHYDLEVFNQCAENEGILLTIGILAGSTYNDKAYYKQLSEPYCVVPARTAIQPRKQNINSKAKPAGFTHGFSSHLKTSRYQPHCGR